MSPSVQTSGSDIQKTTSPTTKAKESEITLIKPKAEGEIFKPGQDHTDIGYGFYQEAI
jgi:hypothetical protein